MRPARETTARKTPRAMTGFSKKRSQSVLAWRESQTPATMIGIDKRKVMKFRIPTRLLLHRTMFSDRVLVFVCVDFESDEELWVEE